MEPAFSASFDRKIALFSARHESREIRDLFASPSGTRQDACMGATPLYDPATAAAYQLRYSWAGWSSSGRFPRGATALIDCVKPLWEADGMRLLEHRWSDEVVQLLFSTKPQVSPQFLATRAKGRLDHAGRKAGLKLSFSRKLAVRSVGDNTRRDIEAYIERQVAKECFADSRFEALAAQFTVHDPTVDLSQPTESVRGRYWYNLHLVLVAQGRTRLPDPHFLERLRDAMLKIAVKKSHRVSRLSVMPDHLHSALRPSPDESPVDVVFAYQNNLAHMLKMGRIWMDSFYVATFGEYAMHAVRTPPRAMNDAASERRPDLIHQPGKLVGALTTFLA